MQAAQPFFLTGLNAGIDLPDHARQIDSASR